MKSVNNSKTLLNSYAKAALFNNELRGQFSDGHWENSSKKHWMWYGEAELTNGEEHVLADIEYIQYRNDIERRDSWKYSCRPSLIRFDNLNSGYGCNSTQLIEVVGARMIAKAAFCEAFKVTKIDTSAFESFIEELGEAAAVATANWFDGELDLKGAHKNFVFKITVEQVEEQLADLKKDAESRKDAYYTKKYETIMLNLQNLPISELVEKMNAVEYSVKRLRKDLKEISKALKVVKNN